MHFNIVDRNRAQSMKEHRAFAWGKYQKKALGIIFWLLGCGLLFIFLGFQPGEPSPFKFDYHIVGTVGILFILVALHHIRFFYKQRKEYFTVSAKLLKDYSQENKNETYITINDISITYQSAFSKIEYIWEAVDSCFESDGLIFVFTQDTIASAIIIDKKLVSPEGFSEISVFIRQRAKPKDRLF
jgi:hypothetical protein